LVGEKLNVPGVADGYSKETVSQKRRKVVFQYNERVDSLELEEGKKEGEGEEGG